MNEHLDKAHHDLDFAVQSLRDAIGKASAVDAIILEPILVDAVRARAALSKLISARAVDARSGS